MTLPLSLEHAQQVADAFDRADTANQETSGRRGCVVHLPACADGDLLVAGDLHGDRESFDRLLVLADLEKHPLRHLVLQEVCHGGPRYASGGCRSHEMLEQVARLKLQFPDRLHFLLSNHELSEVTEHPILKRGKMLNVLFRCGMHQAFGDQCETVRQAMCRFLTSCPVAIRLEHRVWLSHSLPTQVDSEGFNTGMFERQLLPDDMVSGGSAFKLVWGRDYRPENAAAFSQLVDADLLVTGHEACAAGSRTPGPQQLILDSCCAEPSYLLLPLDQPCTLKQAVARVGRL
ncbi:metallophosphoesterase family protein [Lignipirellula cremea]|uniref:Calcineurin-like phosphoesterase domain-containing protein n=1 Tax=Lignipirellula cremea TaxID=2528010 RepID=A0A518DZE1_9BACT|nr:hypothetical protein [Lignipirellula cremea]QDU97192.1 hypothetical protein Pla8534_50370 [Lignipirellula cremea]